MTSSVSPPVPTISHTILLEETAVWTEREILSSYNPEHDLTTISYTQNGTLSAASLIVSQDNAFIAFLTMNEGSLDIGIIGYRTKADSLTREWVSTANFAKFKSKHQRKKPIIKGWISCNGKRMLIEYVPDYSDGHRMVTSDRGRSWESFRLSGGSYCISSDDDYIFFLRRGSGFEQGQIVDVYSTTTWSHIRSWTFAFEAGHRFRDVRILPHLAVDQPVHLAISTDHTDRTVIASSNGLQFQVANIDYSTSGERIWISSGGNYMVYLSKDNEKLHFWDLTNPTYEPVEIIQLLGDEILESVASRGPVITGQALFLQTFHCRFSSENEVVTVIIVNTRSVVILSFLTFNLQLVYKRVEPVTIFPFRQVLQVRIEDAQGVTLVGSMPLSRGENGLKGLVITFAIITGAYEDIRAVETYFDTADVALRSAAKNPSTEKYPIIHQWLIGCDNITRKIGNKRELTWDEEKQQRILFDSVFYHSADVTPATATIQDRVPHLMTVTYPWDPQGQVYLFAVRTEFEYSIIAMAVPSRITETSYLIRVLSISENLCSSGPETVEIVHTGSHYILKVYGRSDGFYSGIPLPSERITIIGHHFMPNDALYDMFIVKEWARTTTMKSGSQVHSAFIANIIASPHLDRMLYREVSDYGHRKHPSYIISKFMVWLDSAHELKGMSEEELLNNLGLLFPVIFEDPVYDDKHPLFPSGLATAATLDILSDKTLLVDEFMKKYHQSDQLIISNSYAISCSLPLVCRARPVGALSFMRHIALFQFRVAENTAITVSNQAYEPRDDDLPRNKLSFFFREIFTLLKHSFIRHSRRKMCQANTTTVTIPLDGFCMYDRHIHGFPVSYVGIDDQASLHFHNMAERAYYDKVATGETGRRYVFSRRKALSQSGRSTRTSPFSCLVEEIFRIKDKEIQLSIIQVIWFEKLVRWKLDTFGRQVFLTRIAVPSIANWIMLVTLSILTSSKRTSKSILVLGAIQAFICAYLITQKLRQARATTLFFRSFYDWMDAIAIILSTTNAILVLTRHTIPRSFFAYSTAIVWMDVLLLARIYEKAGVLFVLLTEMMRGVMPFLILFALVITGFTFIPFLLLKNEFAGPFGNYGGSLGEMIAFISNDFSSLGPFAGATSVQVFRAVFTILVSILFLNVLIALLSLKVGAADTRSQSIWIRQMLVMLVLIERGILTAHERKNQRWFPRWFTYDIGEDEKNQWQSYLEKHPLKLGYDSRPPDARSWPRLLTQVPPIPQTDPRDLPPNTAPTTAPPTTPTTAPATTPTRSAAWRSAVPPSPGSTPTRHLSALSDTAFDYD